MPEETIENEIAELRENRKMSLDMFYRNLYMLDFLGLKDKYSEKDLENGKCHFSRIGRNSFLKWVLILFF